ncbi:MAG: response regulator [Rhizobiaceae bacterium]|nr:response regulator [Rhizobiaceae bacterium]
MGVDLVQGLLREKFVLVMEDEYFIADDIARALTEAGAQVVGPFGHVHQGLDRLKVEPNINLAVLDINLNGTKVFDLAAQLQELGVPFIFATGYGFGHLPEQFAKVPRWEKPFDVSSLANALAALDKSRG